MKKLILLTSSLMIFLLITISFTVPTNSEQWTKFKSYNGVDFYQKTITCNNPNGQIEYIIFKYINTTNKDISLKWTLHNYFGENCRSCNLKSPNEYEFTLNLKPKQTIQGNCNSTQHSLKLFKKDLSNPNSIELTKFEFFNLR